MVHQGQAYLPVRTCLRRPTGCPAVLAACAPACLPGMHLPSAYASIPALRVVQCSAECRKVQVPPGPSGPAGGAATTRTAIVVRDCTLEHCSQSCVRPLRSAGFGPRAAKFALRGLFWGGLAGRLPHKPGLQS
eukprot:1403140-Prymnesium_polylepis.1